MVLIIALHTRQYFLGCIILIVPDFSVLLDIVPMAIPTIKHMIDEIEQAIMFLTFILSP